MPAPTLREISRQATRRRISEIAEALFLTNGYDATTVEDIAREAGISERTFFRYFTSKAEVFFIQIDTDTRALLEAIDSRPIDEAPWVSLQQALTSALATLDPRAAETRSRLLHEIAQTAPQVQAQYLTRVHAAQRELSEALAQRWTSERKTDADARVILRAMVSSMFSALNEVERALPEQSLPERIRVFQEVLDAIRPARVDIGGAPPPPRSTTPQPDRN